MEKEYTCKTCNSKTKWSEDYCFDHIPKDVYPRATMNPCLIGGLIIYGIPPVKSETVD